MTSEQIEEIGLKRLARVTVRWEGFRDEHGNPAECNTANAYELYKAMPHIARQVEEFVLDPANFGQEGEKVEPLTAETYMAAVAKLTAWAEHEYSGQAQKWAKLKRLASEGLAAQSD